MGQNFQVTLVLNRIGTQGFNKKSISFECQVARLRRSLREPVPRAPDALTQSTCGSPSVNGFSTRVPIEGTVLTSPSGNGTCHFGESLERLEGLAICRAKVVPSFISYYKAL